MLEFKTRIYSKYNNPTLYKCALFIFAPRQFSIENFGGLSDSPRPSVTGCAARNLWGDLCMKLTYNGTTKPHISNFYKNKLLRYFFKMNLPVLSDSCYNLNWPIYNCFLIGLCKFPLSTVRSGIFNIFKYMLLRYFCKTIVTLRYYQIHSMIWIGLFTAVFWLANVRFPLFHL